MPRILTTSSKFFFIIISILFSLSCAERNEPQVYFPFNVFIDTLPFVSTPTSPQILLMVKVQDRPYHLVLDTGNPQTLLNSDVPSKKIKHTHFHNILLQCVPANQVLVDTLELGGIKILNLDSYQQRNLNIDGILGSDIIKNFVWKIDLLHHKAYVTQDITNFGSLGEGIPFKWQGEHIAVNATVKGIKMDLVLDTGYSGFINLNKSSIDSLGDFEPIFWEGISTRQVGNPYALPSYAPHIDSTYYLTGDLAIQDMVLEDEIMELRKFPLNFLGMDFFKRFDHFIIDYPNQKIYFGNQQFKSVQFIFYSLLKLNSKGLTLVPSKHKAQIGRMTPEIKELGIGYTDTILCIDGVSLMDRDSSFYTDNSIFHEDINTWEYNPSPFQSLWHKFHFISDTSNIEVKRGDSSQTFTLLRQYNFTAMPDSIYDYYLDLSLPYPAHHRVRTEADTYYFKFKAKDVLPWGFQNQGSPLKQNQRTTACMDC